MFVPDAYVKNGENMPKMSATSQSCRQQILSPISVTSIDVAVTYSL